MQNTDNRTDAQARPLTHACPHFISPDAHCECGGDTFRWTGPATAKCVACEAEYDVARAVTS